MTDSVQTPREMSEDVTSLHELHEKALREERTSEIVAIEMLLVESNDEIEPVLDDCETGVSIPA
jgi:hypothetical protein